ncbi:MAG: hypothetical protein ACE5GA_11160, partial [Candidatus Zixiibacteriota bacterium]
LAGAVRAQKAYDLVQRMTEDIMLSLRTTRGIDLHEFSVKHGAELKQACDAREYSRLMESGHLAPEGSFLRLSNDSLALADEIIARLIG